MSLIDKDYLVGEINIAQTQSVAVQQTIALFITKRETEYLKKALGYAFYKLFIAAITDTSGKWYDLRTGAEYEDADGITRQWTGFQNAGKQSPIANYVYYWMQRDNVTFTTSTGEKEGKGENADNASSAGKMRRAWNEMVDQTCVLYDFLLNKKDDDGNLVYDDFNYDEVECNELTKKVYLYNL